MEINVKQRMAVRCKNHMQKQPGGIHPVPQDRQGGETRSILRFLTGEKINRDSRRRASPKLGLLPCPHLPVSPGPRTQVLCRLSPQAKLLTLRPEPQAPQGQGESEKPQENVEHFSGTSSSIR